MTDTAAIKRERKSHIWAREIYEHYVEPSWTSRRLFEMQVFHGDIFDPACGFGTIVKSARAMLFEAAGADVVDRGFEGTTCRDFRHQDFPVDNVVSNPPFNIAAEFALHALKVARERVAIIFPTARLNAAHWIKGTPLRRVWMLTPRPSMPPGHVIAAGGKAQGGKMDFCWLVFDQGYVGHPEIRWLHRDGP